ncbi:hypothetical protein DNTS_012148, partial [Danionella cerebrum]
TVRVRSATADTRSPELEKLVNHQFWSCSPTDSTHLVPTHCPGDSWGLTLTTGKASCRMAIEAEDVHCSKERESAREMVAEVHLSGVEIASLHLENSKAPTFIPDMELREEWQDEEFPR